MADRYARAHLLLDQDRFEMAEAELRERLTENPGDGFAHSLLALSLSGQEKHKEAVAAARESVSLEPDFAPVHQILAQVQLNAGDWKSAEKTGREALRLDPESAETCNLLAWAASNRADWDEVLRFADLGLSIDPENTGCNNARAHALQMMRRGDEAQASLDATLRRAPEDAFTHANQGWHYLRDGNAPKALEHFKESLRLEPGHEYARSGVIEALKAHNPVYKPILAYFVFMSRLSQRARWFVIIGALLGFRVVRALLSTSPGLRPLLYIAIGAYLLLILTTWAGPTLFNLTLWFHPLGRHALNRDERHSSMMCLGALIAAIACLAGALILPEANAGYFWAVVFPFLCLPIASTFNTETPSKRKLGYCITAGFAAAMIAGSVTAFLNHPNEPGALWLYTILGLAVFSWFGNIVMKD